MLKNINSAAVSFCKYVPPAVAGPQTIYYATPEERLRTYSPAYSKEVRRKTLNLTNKYNQPLPKTISDQIFDVASASVAVASLAFTGFIGLKILKLIKSR